MIYKTVSGDLQDIWSQGYLRLESQEWAREGETTQSFSDTTQLILGFLKFFGKSLSLSLIFFTIIFAENSFCTIFWKKNKRRKTQAAVLGIIMM